MKIGYARVSSVGQSLELQLAELGKAECDKIYREKASASSTNGRPELERALDQLRAGDELVITRLDRLARSLPDLYAIVQRISDAGATFACLQQGAIDTGTSTGKLMLGVLGAVAQFERDLLLERQAEGIAARKAAGGYRGRRSELDPAEVKAAYAEHGSYRLAAKALGCHKSSVERIVSGRPRQRSASCNTADKGAPTNDKAV